MTLPKPYYDEGGITIYHAEAMAVLRALPASGFDAVITDPPYSSGALHIGGRGASPLKKYQQHGTVTRFGDFEGDSRDARSWKSWCAEWLRLSLRVTKSGGRCLVFSDWRQLPNCTDAMQWAGWRWRGLISWDKGRAARAPHTGYFRHQCEYISWGSRGDLAATEWGGPFDGSYTIPVLQRDKFHLTGKPTQLLEALVASVRPRGSILDPFMGSGTALLAAKRLGHRAVGVEMEEANCRIAVERLRADAAGLAMRCGAA